MGFFKEYLLLVFLLLMCTVVKSQQVTIHGYIRDAKTGEALIAASFFDKLSCSGVTTNNAGYFNISLDKGKVELSVNYVGYLSFDTVFTVSSNMILNCSLEEKTEAIGEITVSAEKPLHEQTLMGRTLVSIDKILETPSFMGEPDLMKALTTIPGVSSGRDGRSNIYVRGGDRGQNLILLDGAKLYNTNHIGGFMSLFNASIVKQVEVYKGGFPARYGGRASSVIDVYTRDGNSKEWKGKFNVGLLMSGLTLEGPITKKLSCLLTTRTSYYDLFTIYGKRQIKLYGKGDYFTFHVFDVNAKLSYVLNDRHRMFLNYFNGFDFYKNYTKTRTSSAKGLPPHNYDVHKSRRTVGDDVALGGKEILKNTIAYSGYNNALASVSEYTRQGIHSSENYTSTNKIEEYHVESRLEYYASQLHSLKAGFEYSNYSFVPGTYQSFTEDEGAAYLQDTSYGYFYPLYANEIDLYIEDEIKFSSNYHLNIGVRQVAYLANDRNYYRTEPRVSFRAMLNDNLSFKAGYSLMNQFNHVVVSSYGFFEKEMWLASTADIPPQRASQFSAGVFATIPRFKLELSAEAYYKKMDNLLEYNISSTDDIVATSLDDILITGGIGEAYGAEFMAKYKTDGLTIDFSYVLSWNNRRFDELNHGEWYPFIYDRRHDFSCQAVYVIGKHYSISSNFVFATGTPYTFPDAYVKANDYSYGYYAYSGIYNRRLPNYHRLDLSLVKKKRTKRGRMQSFQLNIYNAYAQQNPLIIYYDSNSGKVYKKSMFSILPTISYSLEF